MSENLNLGQIITTPQQRDAIHIAVVPVTAAEPLKPAERVSYASGQIARGGNVVGVVDPFLTRSVRAGEQCWLYLNPGSITSLRHDWTHPAFEPQTAPERSPSEKWMRAWALRNVSEDYYGERGRVSEEEAYAFAIKIGYDHQLGPHECARDEIDSEWWGHWEAITGVRGNRDAYFSCSC